jgi:transcriptional/translational regulatory protein YebC/TACO1
VGGPNPDHNPQLANTLAAAKKAGVPKAVIDAAVARGQGKSSTGASLESVTIEAIMPPSVALIVEVETESKARVLQEMNHFVKRFKGSTGSSKFFFSRVGRVVFEGNGKTVDEVMDEAIEAGAEDIEDDEDGNIVVWTQPNQTAQVYQALSDRFGLKVLSSDIIWSPNEDTKVQLDKGIEATNLSELLAALKEHHEIQAVYSNVTKGTVPDDVWEAIEESLDE